MAESFGSEITMVEVKTDHRSAPRQLWVAAAKPSQALTLVLCAIPLGWNAEIASDRLTRRQLSELKKLNLEPGEVRELKG
jgi:hypothetical protein